MNSKIFISVFVCFLAIVRLTQGQQPDHVWLETSKLKVRVNADGRLFCDDKQGAFLVPKGDSMVSLVHSAGLWFGGFDSGYNLIIRTQSMQNSDFISGIQGISNSGKVWKVTRAEIENNLKDYWSDLESNDPVPSLYAWPAKGNRFFATYNGFDWPDSMSLFNFEEVEKYGRFNPDLGEYPALTDHWQLPTQMASFVSYGKNSYTNINVPLPGIIGGTVFVYDCPESELLSNSVFVHYHMRRYNDDIRLDSCVLSLFNDIDLGDPLDDYIGYLPESNTLYFYNASNQDKVWGQHTPLFFITIHKRPLVYTNDFSPLEVMPVGQPDNLSGTGFPTLPSQYYNYMTGTWKDGTPLSPEGTGYNPWHSPSLPPTKIAFAGYPEDPDAWTEWNAQNQKGNRAALINMILGEMHPTQVSDFTVQYSYMPWQEGSLTERIHAWEQAQADLFESSGITEPKPKQLPCMRWDRPSLVLPDNFTVFPNPANQHLKVWGSQVYFKKMVLYDVSGRVAGVGEYKGSFSEIDVSQLSPGIYFLQMESETGSKKVTKIVIEH